MLSFTSFWFTITLLPSTAVWGATEMEFRHYEERAPGNEDAVTGETIFQADLPPREFCGRLKRTTLSNYFVDVKLCVCMSTEVSYPRGQEMMYVYNFPHTISREWYKDADFGGRASWVDSYSRRNAFIASGSPLKYGHETSFWNMVWNNHVRIIVMLTRTYENGVEKSTQYWPASLNGYIESDVYKVTSIGIDAAYSAGYTCSQLNLRNKVIDDFREIIHCQFKNWPDMQQPTDTEQLLAFTRHIKVLASEAEESDATTQAPILIHCMAGLGRTGTYIAIDVLIERMESEPGHWVDVQGVVERLRVQRPHAVLTNVQYHFCATALQAHMCNNREHSGCVFCATELETLDDPINEDTVIAEQRIMSIYQTDLHRDMSASCVSISEGQLSTRTSLFDSFRGSRTPDSECSDEEEEGGIPPKQQYQLAITNIQQDNICGDFSAFRKDVNEFPGQANWLDTYDRTSAFIASEAPQNNDEGFAFWRMVWQNNVRVIVMLNRPQEGERHPYLPIITTPETHKYAFKILSINDFVNSDGFKCSRMHLINFMENEVRVVRHCVFNLWPENSIPIYTDQLLGFRRIINFLATLSSSEYVEIDKPTPIVLHCTDARDKVATFVAIDVMIKRTEYKYLVYLMGVVERVNIQLPGFTMTSAQYDFCLTALHAYDCTCEGENLCRAFEKRCK